MNNVLFKIVRGIVWCIAKVLFPFKAEGKENIPESGGLVMCCNHISNLDPVLIILTCRRRVYFMAKSELFKNKLAASFFKFAGAFPVNRGSADAGAIDQAKDIVNRGDVFGIFVEGTRTKNADHSPGRPKTGASVVAASTGGTVLPVAVIYKKGGLRPFRRVTVRYGQPMNDELPEVNGNDRKALREITAIIMDRITRLWRKGI